MTHKSITHSNQFTFLATTLAATRLQKLATETLSPSEGKRYNGWRKGHLTLNV
jgi:hypothetical protein